METNTFSGRLVVGAGVLGVCGAGLLIPVLANAAPSGIITFNPATGSDTTIVGGVTSGPCDVGATDPNTPTNSYDVVVTGPGAFAPNPGAGRPDGVAFRAQTPSGFSSTQPITFSSRVNFHDLAQELGQPLEPGDYVVTLRCDSDFGPTGQSFQGTIHFTGGPPATAYTTNTPPPPPTTSTSPPPPPTTSTSLPPPPIPQPTLVLGPTPPAAALLPPGFWQALIAWLLGQLHFPGF